MTFAHLDQSVRLGPGEPWLLLQAVSVLVADVTHATAPVPPVQLLTTLPLASLMRKLINLHQKEYHAPPRLPGRPPKLRHLRVTIDQLAALHHNRAALYCCVGSPAEKLLLQGIIGKFQQKSLNLSQFIKFS